MIPTLFLPHCGVKMQAKVEALVNDVENEKVVFFAVAGSSLFYLPYLVFLHRACALLLLCCIDLLCILLFLEERSCRGQSERLNNSGATCVHLLHLASSLCFVVSLLLLSNVTTAMPKNLSPVPLRGCGTIL